MATEIPVQNETMASMTRTTRDGRQLTYEMLVIQQPEQARACGSGAKSSADRRPVDPPPVVELHVFEDNGSEKKDITFSHNANFFLFTTLENARPINQGRVVSAPTLPVLTGTPVAGIAYLDRPKQAGYFIFPDLSVRHEGRYRLSFNLFEELKDSKDADADPSEASPNATEKGQLGNPMAPRHHVNFRLEVKSTSFVVYSAKKFPGLKESTQLSRCVADQGCRVRIRRDVRMRRRDKVTESYQDMSEEHHYPSSEHFPTPRQVPDRPRSVSNGSMDAPSPWNSVRRPSTQEGTYFQQQSYQQPPPPMPANPANSYQSHLSFGPQNTPHYQTPAVAAPPPPPPPPTIPQTYTQNNAAYQYAPPAHSRQMSGPQSYTYPSQPQPQPSPYSQSPTYMDEALSTYEQRRASAGMTSAVRAYIPQEPYVPSHQVMQSHMAHPSQQSQPSPTRSLTPINTKPPGPPPSLPPITTLVAHTPMEMKNEPISTTSAVPQGPQNPFSASSSSYTSSGFNPYASSNTPQNSNQPITQTKRSFGAVFETNYLNGPMHGGMRPSSAHHGQDVIAIENSEGVQVVVDDSAYTEHDLHAPLVYKRADGSRSYKNCPSPRSSHRRHRTHAHHSQPTS